MPLIHLKYPYMEIFHHRHGADSLLHSDPESKTSGDCSKLPLNNQRTKPLHSSGLYPNRPFSPRKSFKTLYLHYFLHKYWVYPFYETSIRKHLKSYISPILNSKRPNKRNYSLHLKVLQKTSSDLGN